MTDNSNRMAIVLNLRACSKLVCQTKWAAVSWSCSDNGFLSLLMLLVFYVVVGVVICL